MEEKPNFRKRKNKVIYTNGFRVEIEYIHRPNFKSDMEKYLGEILLRKINQELQAPYEPKISKNPHMLQIGRDW